MDGTAAIKKYFEAVRRAYRSLRRDVRLSFFAFSLGQDDVRYEPEEQP